MSAILKESRMPFAVRMAGQAFAIAYATGSVMFIALVWVIPSYAIQAPPKKAIAPHTRRGSACTTASATSTLIDSEPLVELELEVPPERVEVEVGIPVMVAPADLSGIASKLPKKKRSQIFSKLSSSVAPVAKHITIPTKKLTASVATKMTPRKIVASAQAKCSSVVASVHIHIPRQLSHFKNAPMLHVSPKKGAAVLASCNATIKKLVVPDSARWQRPRKQSSL
ncbi:hypothetical protein APHAL10511_005917 [Amanita phalloides]|nr:hypothetical protein APHAL10511_005917 [Amanita phalloides]